MRIIIQIVFCTILLFACNSYAITTQSLIPNNNFSELDQDGNPKGWSCTCAGAKSQSASCEFHKNTSNGNTLKLYPGCTLTSLISLKNQDAGITLSVNNTTKPTHFEDLTLSTFMGNNLYYAMETTHPREIQTNADGFTTSSKPASTQNIKYIRVTAINSQSTPIEIKEINVIQQGANPIEKSGSLLKATHLTGFKLVPNSTIKDIWMPLPLDYASQVPLWLDMKSTPLSAIQSIRYTQDRYGNWGAIVTLKNNVPAGTSIYLEWEGIVLTRKLDDNEKPFVYQSTNDPSLWLQPSLIAQSEYQPITTTALDISKNAVSSLEKMLKINLWTSDNIKYFQRVEDLKSLDAITVFNNKISSCTGYANLASAMGRAIHIPTRTLVNYLVGYAQQTHYINEFYLGPDLGWRRIEPQNSSPFTTEDYVISMRIATPDDENDPAVFHQDAIPGVPYLSLTTSLNDPTAIIDSVDRYFPDAPTSDNRAEHLYDLRSTHAEMEKLFLQSEKKLGNGFK